MEERKIKLATLALLTPIKEVLNDVAIPTSLFDISEEYRTIIQKADELLKYGKSAVTDRIYLESIFNVLNGNNDKMFYQDRCLDDYTEDINYPVSQVDSNGQTDYRRKATERINLVLSEIVFSDVWLSKFFEIPEPELTYMPGTLQDPDISLYDQSKLCAAFALCLSDSRNSDEEAFILYSMDFSGIQDFIYTIQRKGALKTLRARSFYLEMLMENAIDDVLEDIGLSRINVLYSGGGHCYMLLPNGKETTEKLEEHNKKALLCSSSSSRLLSASWRCCTSRRRR